MPIMHGMQTIALKTLYLHCEIIMHMIVIVVPHMIYETSQSIVLYMYTYIKGASGVSRNCQMGVLEKVGRSMPRAKRAGAHVSAPVWGVWGSSPRIFFCFTCSEIDSNAILAKKC